MMAEDRQQDMRTQVTTSRRRMLAAAALAPMLAGAGAGAAAAQAPTGGMRETHGPGRHRPVKPVHTSASDWADVADALGRSGNMLRGMIYHTGFPRQDLHVVSDGVAVRPGLALGAHVAFVRYADGSTMTMGDVVVAENELQQASDAWQTHGIAQTALHKHLLSQTPEIWWTHVHGHSHDPVALARGLRAGFDRTRTPPPQPTGGPPPPIDLDVAAIEAVLGNKGSNEGGIYKNLFVRREIITDGHLILPPGLGSTSAFNFQPLCDGRAALSGDCAMTAGEVQDVLRALRRGGIKLVELHNHHLTDNPRLFFVHIWAVDDAVKIARALRAAMDATNVVPAGVGD
ncbi:DUF1259 domain-containing protein [Streptomyces sp. NBC_00841]|uniref:DUF1259 domain-containing protein n=1 Tax=unclassified Streptomyces TaxID=2593676 RepID=UPI0022560C4B|nr:MULTISPECIES: DUF1259 domain-containing protein [unclassified Streptomyces]MCX4533736.1 DUF1259 domain-containing protein [Streptomyces sp. NBC_01669]WSA00866.1 DUF1259 domain-containing protein [Streptomyces sp. NBC_00841]